VDTSSLSLPDLLIFLGLHTLAGSVAVLGLIWVRLSAPDEP
jgi:hypothetical protein